MHADVGDELGPPPRSVEMVGTGSRRGVGCAFVLVVGAVCITLCVCLAVLRLEMSLVTGFWSFAALLAVMIILQHMWPPVFRERRLAKYGRVGRGRVVSVKREDWQGRPLTDCILISYVYTGPDGVERRWDGEVELKPGSEFEEGGPITILYDPRNPERHAPWAYLSADFRVKQRG